MRDLQAFQRPLALQTSLQIRLPTSRRPARHAAVDIQASGPKKAAQRAAAPAAAGSVSSAAQPAAAAEAPSASPQAASPPGSPKAAELDVDTALAKELAENGARGGMGIQRVVAPAGR